MRTWGDFSESFRAAVKVNLLLGVVCMAFGFWLVWLEGTASGRWYEGLPQILMTVAFGDGILCLGLALFMFAAKKNRFQSAVLPVCPMGVRSECRSHDHPGDRFPHGGILGVSAVDPGGAVHEGGAQLPGVSG